MKRNINGKKILIGILVLILLISIGMNIYFLASDENYDPMVNYLRDPWQIRIVETGILQNHLEFRPGTDYEITYDFENEEYPILMEQYDLEKLAGEGSEFEQAFNLMNEFGPRLSHQGDFGNTVEMNALSLLEYSLDRPDCGINCRNKAQILNEMCLALGIYARKVWIMPNSVYDNECHVVNEIWDSTLEKWVMLDITNNQYWVDAEGTPLSVLEVRELGAKQEFCTPVFLGQELDNLEKALNNNYGIYLYFMKNLVYMEYCDTQTVGETDTVYYLLPENLSMECELVISEEAVMCSPIK